MINLALVDLTIRSKPNDIDFTLWGMLPRGGRHRPGWGRHSPCMGYDAPHHAVFYLFNLKKNTSVCYLIWFYLDSKSYELDINHKIMIYEYHGASKIEIPLRRGNIDPVTLLCEAGWRDV